jgi:hypothetical protein
VQLTGEERNRSGSGVGISPIVAHAVDELTAPGVAAP